MPIIFKIANLNLLITFALFLTSCEDIGTAHFDDLGTTGSTSNIASFTFSGISSINQVTDTTATINWNHHSSAKGYVVYQVSSSIIYVASIMAPTATYSLTDLDSSTTYTYRVHALDSYGYADTNTNDISFTTLSSPNKPSGLSLQNPTSSKDFETTPTIRVSGVKSGDTVKLFMDSNCSTEVGSGISSGSTIDITTSSLSTANYTFYANAINSNLQASSCSTANVSYTVISCPSGYIKVPTNTTLGVSSFCIMQFEAKNDGSNNAVSQATGTPWTAITQSDAKSKCLAIGSNYDLVSNSEWMTTALNIEENSTNWSGSKVGYGMLPRGHTDSSPNLSLAVTNTSDAYDGTGNNSGQAIGSGWEQKRYHILSNSEVIWDFSGNVLEWTDWSFGGGLTSGPTTCTGAYTEIPDVNCGAFASSDYMPDNPSGQSPSIYNSVYGLGKIYGGVGGGAIRGGYYAGGDTSGIFALDLSNAPILNSSAVGYRCVYRP